MPAIRSSRQPSRQPLQSHPPNATPDRDVIELSSDEEPLSSMKSPPPKRSRPNSKQKARAPPPASVEVVEISSDEEALSRSSKASSSQIAITQLRQQLKAAQDEVERLKGEADVHSKELAQAHSAQSKTGFSDLEDHINCEICTLRLWTPYALPCGHTFCQNCLTDWFGTTLAQHMAAHPNHNMHAPHVEAYRMALLNPALSVHARRQLQAQILAFEQHGPRPKYTCPTCRAVVLTKPVEVFALKSIVEIVAGAMGESAPKKAALAAPTRTRSGAATRSGSATRHLDDPWDGFFPGT